MNPTEYIKNALITESRDMGPVKERLQDTSLIRLMHSFIGLETETAELQDVLKKHIFYGKSLDKINLKEELGDIMWYVAIACDELGISLEEVMEKNIAKLKARYGEKFTEAAAINRDLNKEYEILK